MGSDVVIRERVPALVEEPASLAATARTPEQAIEFAAECAGRLKAVIDRQGLKTIIKGREHVNIEGWTLLASMTAHTPLIEWVRRADPEIGRGWEARCHLLDADGRLVAAGQALALVEEEAQWGGDEYSMYSMAQTRATSRAIRLKLGYIVNLAGYATTPAEEMPADGEPRRRKGGGAAPRGGGETTGAPESPPPTQTLEEFRAKFLKDAGVPPGQATAHVKRVLELLGHRSWKALATTTSERREQALTAVRAQFARVAAIRVPVASSDPEKPDYEVILRRRGIEVDAECPCEGYQVRRLCRHLDKAWNWLGLKVVVGDEVGIDAEWGDLDLAAIAAQYREQWEEAFPKAAQERRGTDEGVVEHEQSADPDPGERGAGDAEGAEGPLADGPPAPGGG